MTITTVNSSTFIADLVNYLRDQLLTNITDPLGSRTGNDKFVMTSYPQRPVRYPIITVVDRGVSQEGKLGMGSEGTILRLMIEIRLWGRNVKERDELFGLVHNWLRTNQLDTGTTSANIYDFNIRSVVNVSEENVKSKVVEVAYLFICE